jgi:hypothetical protein
LGLDYKNRRLFKASVFINSKFKNKNCGIPINRDNGFIIFLIYLAAERDMISLATMSAMISC